MTHEEEIKTIEEFAAIADNPMNALKVYAPFKRFARFFLLVSYDNLNVKVKGSVGDVIVDRLMDCYTLLPKCQFGKRESKIAATEAFLYDFATILACVEFIVENNVGISIRQGTELLFLIKEIQTQMGGFKRYLNKECHQDSEPTGERSE